MATEPHAPGSAPQRLFARVGNPLDWSLVDRALLLAVVWLGVVLVIGASYWHAMHEPASVPFFNHEFLLQMWALLPITAILWIVIVAAGIVLRTRSPGNRLYVALVLVLWWYGESIAAYFIGALTTPALMMTLGQGFIALLLFDLQLAALGLGWGLTIFTGTTIAVQLGYLPYAPMLVEPLSPGHRLPMFWAFGMGGVYLCAMMGFLVAFHHVITRWRDREEKLAQATKLIQRYVPSQLAEEILAGDFAAKERPERRAVTVFFSDIKGFTNAAERLNPDELSRVLNEYLSEMAEIAKQHGGTVDKFVGDAVMVSFGAPKTMEESEQARRAVRMAQDMQKRMIFLREKWFDEGIESPFEIRIGINTGLAHVGNFGSSDRLDYTVIGHNVNIAARLESSCTPGEILISEATYQLIRNEIPCEDKGEIQVKGIAAPVRAHEVITS